MKTGVVMMLMHSNIVDTYVMIRITSKCFVKCLCANNKHICVNCRHCHNT